MSELTGRMQVIVEAEKAKARERQLTRKLSYRLINIGYRELLAKLNPDSGKVDREIGAFLENGSAEAIARLNKVRKILKRVVKG